jgi:uncharacterized protein YndB with AHSA1/START domain
MSDALELEFTVACPPEWAFEVWAVETSRWWPRSHSRSGDPEVVAFEPRPGGRIYERTSDGVEHEWGEVLAWEPPSRIAYLWHIYGERADATEVEITFAATEEGSTRVRIVHTGWDRLGERGARLRERNESNWRSLLEHYLVACER